MNSNIDFLIIGTDLYGATFGRILTNAGYKCLILDKRNHIGGNVYSEKQWGCKCTELPSDIIKRSPLRFYFDNNYFNDKFQGIPTNGYEVFIKNIIENVPYLCDIEFKIEDYSYWSNHVKYNIIYCGAPDELLQYDIGELGWRSLRFEDVEFEYNGSNGQGAAIINDVTTNPITRTVEHMWFTPNVVYNGIKSIITKEYPDNWNREKEKYYPINNEKNNQLYIKYVDYLSKIYTKIKLGGRLGKYKYFDMDDTILEAMHDAISFIEIHSL